MGRGDKRTKRGKIFAGSFGNTRKRKTKTTKPVTSKTTSAPAKKAPAKKASK